MNEIKAYDYLPQCALDIRVEVFVHEQGFFDDQDEIDLRSTHLVMTENDTPIATCRVFSGEREGSYILGRLAVLKSHRGRGAGAKMLSAAEAQVAKMGGQELVLHSTVFMSFCRLNKNM